MIVLPERPQNKPRYEWRETYKCDHSAPRHDQKNRIIKRVGKKSTKVGCMARLTVAKLLGSTDVNVTADVQHQNHDPHSVESMIESRISPQVSKVLQEWIDRGESWLSIENYLEVLDDLLEKVWLCLPFHFSSISS